ncbi:NmrA/HSCARG family protein [Anaeromyxobacter diazotrophicus]|uniref:NmrA-like domain-containing protein n=1 Tax=Anaeromyxobacter diazotrophicus TaxID=2590199 RepID=A0A7I9VH98_9BACT|nr:NmrA/HSCARG family protein [Anaeromyxobacter diazotrophicus]GEJ55417.1 hypothetical protein AMYX_01580 [Anaeromyxobacter diazotrophicus]
MPKPITVLVAGATGRQGGAVARALLDHGHAVRALTRRPGSERAAALHAAGAELHEGDLDDGAAVERAAAGADAFFLMATPFEEGAGAEVRQGQRAAEAARRAGVKHLVYSSVAGADQGTGIPHFDSKAEIERHVQALGVPYTIVAPVFFMENLLSLAVLRGLRTGTLALPLPAARSLQMVAVEDLGAFVRLVVERPGSFQGQRVEIASDEVTGREAARALAEVTRSAIGYSEVPLAEVRRQSEDLGRMWAWFDLKGYGCDLAALRSAYPEVGWHDLRAWAREQDWSELDQAGAEQPTA